MTPTRLDRMTCPIEDCGRPVDKRIWCNRHYIRWLRHGDPQFAVFERGTDMIERRFWSKVDRRGPNECWPWMAGLTTEGYAKFRRHGRDGHGHRFVYELLVGPIPEGLELDHLCRNRGCVNPAHLEPVAHQENILRGVGITAQLARQTHCKRGHEFTPENTYRRPNQTNRECRKCRVGLR